MDAILDNVDDLIGAIGEENQDGPLTDRSTQWLHSRKPSLLLIAEVSGRLISWQNFGEETDDEFLESLAVDLADLLIDQKSCWLEISLGAQRHVAWAVRSSEQSRQEIFACVMPHGDPHEESPDYGQAAVVVCRAFAWAAVFHREQGGELRTRVEHLRNEHDMIKALHAVATTAALEEREERLREQKENLALEELCQLTEAADRAKSQFLASMSHELRTPLHGILSFAAFGIKKIETGSREDLLRYFSKIDGCGTVLMTLLNDLLDLAKLESGKMSFEFGPLDLGVLVGSIADEFSSAAALRKLTIEVLTPETGTRIYGDQTRLMQVLRNLLSNAVKFSPDGAIIQVELQREGDSVQLSVRDQGIGIPENELKEVFDKFIQSSKTRTGAGGTGLGLSICLEIIEAHKGRIWAENNPDGGAVVRFRIPADLKQLQSDDSAAAAKP